MVPCDNPTKYRMFKTNVASFVKIRPQTLDLTDESNFINNPYYQRVPHLRIRLGIKIYSKPSREQNCKDYFVTIFLSMGLEQYSYTSKISMTLSLSRLATYGKVDGKVEMVKLAFLFLGSGVESGE